MLRKVEDRPDALVVFGWDDVRRLLSWIWWFRDSSPEVWAGSDWFAPLPFNWYVLT